MTSVSSVRRAALEWSRDYIVRGCILQLHHEAADAVTILNSMLSEPPQVGLTVKRALDSDVVRSGLRVIEYREPWTLPVEGKPWRGVQQFKVSYIEYGPDGGGGGYWLVEFRRKTSANAWTPWSDHGGFNMETLDAECTLEAP